jgi:hypothetical protein
MRLTELCVEHDEVSVIVKDTIVSLREIKISTVEINQNLSTNPSKPFQTLALNMSLPKKRPRLNIDNIKVTTERVPVPLSFSLKESTLNEFFITGDLNAQLSVTNNMITTSIDLMSPLVQRYSIPYLQRLKGKLRLTSDGLTANVNANIDAASIFVKPQCRINTEVKGRLSAEIDLQAPLASIDLNKLKTKVTLEACKSAIPETYIDYVQSTLDKPYSISLPNQLEITPSFITVPKVMANNTSSDEIIIRNFRMQLANMAFDFTGHWHHSSRRLGQFTHDIKVKNKNRQFISEHHLRFEAPQVTVNNIALYDTSLQSRFKVAADFASDIVSISGAGEAHSNRIAQAELALDNVTLDFDVKGDYSEIFQLKTHLALKSNTVTVQDVKLDNLGVETLLTIDAQQHLDLSMRTSVAQSHFPKGRLGSITQQFALRSNFDLDKLKSGDLPIEINGSTRIDSLLLAGTQADNIKVETQGYFNRTLSLEHIVEYADLSVLIEHELLTQHHPFTIVFAEQPIQSLQPLLSGISPNLQFSSGIMNGKINGDIHSQEASFRAELQGISVLYDSHYVENINTTFTGELNSGEINIANSNMSIEQVRSGAVLSDLSANYILNSEYAMLSNIRANVFNGQVYVPQFLLFSEQQVLDVQLFNLDLGMLAEAGRDAGVTLSGMVSGKLPISLEKDVISIQNGQLYNVDVGQLLVQNNASVEALKAQQPSLETVIGLLDNLTVHTLSSDVNLSPDGWLTLGVKIIGENEAQAQPVNFNYTHSENIFTLFRALRLSDEITQRVEQALIKSE